MRFAAGVGRVLVGAATLLMLTGLALFAVGVYLVGLPLRRAEPRQLATARALADLAAAAGVLIALRSKTRGENVTPPPTDTAGPGL